MWCASSLLQLLLGRKPSMDPRLCFIHRVISLLQGPSRKIWSVGICATQSSHQIGDVGQRKGKMDHRDWRLDHRRNFRRWSWDFHQWRWVSKVSELQYLYIQAGMTLRNFRSNWKWPQIPGIHDFKGKLLHSASWDDSYDFKDKTVVVIGSGSSAIQIVPQLQPGNFGWAPS